MNIADFITELYCQIDDTLPDLPQHPQALLGRSEVVTIGVLYAMKNVSRRAFYSWLRDNYGHLFPKLLKNGPASSGVWKPRPAGPATSWPSHHLGRGRQLRHRTGTPGALRT